MATVPQRQRQTDRQTDGRTDGRTDRRRTIEIPRYAHSAPCGKNCGPRHEGGLIPSKLNRHMPLLSYSHCMRTTCHHQLKLTPTEILHRRWSKLCIKKLCITWPISNDMPKMRKLLYIFLSAFHPNENCIDLKRSMFQKQAYI